MGCVVFNRSIVMAIQPKRFRVVLLVITLGIALGFGTASVARAENTPDIGELGTKVEPSVVTVKTNHGLGSGFVVDPRGLIMTNYHVIEGANKAEVVFSSDKDKPTFPVDGYVAIFPPRDLALIAFKPGAKKLVALKLAEKLPARGEWVSTFGSPLGLSSTAAEGKISAIRTGTELIDLTKRGPKSIYEMLGYDPKSTWLQHTAPISHGNSGGPLINARAEVVGINTWTLPEGQNLNFAISSPHIIEFVRAAGGIVHPLSSLPAPRAKQAEGPDMGDPVATFAIWKQLNQAKNALDEKIASAEKRLEQIPSLNPRIPASKQNVRNKKVAKLFKDIGKSYSEYASRLRNLKNEQADRDLIITIVKETNTADKVGGAYQEIAEGVLQQGGSREPEMAAGELKQHLADLRSSYDVLRINLSRKYDKTFPTQEDTAKEGDSPSSDDTAANGGGKHKGGSKTVPDKSALRTWTDRAGTHHIEARFRGVEDGKAKLEKSDGAVIKVPVSKLSDEDQRFIGEE
jgi:S1-C subfamily serine protease